MNIKPSAAFGLVAKRLLEGAFIILFLLQIYWNIRLHQRIRALEAALRTAQVNSMSDTFRVGDTVAPVPVRGLDGKEFLLNPSAAHKNMMMLVIDPNCDACREALEDVRNGDFKHRALVVISVNEKGTREVVQQLAPITYVLLPNLPLHAKMKFSHAPTVLLLTPTGRITRICSRPLNCG
jgi:hypothetical protein